MRMRQLLQGVCQHDDIKPVGCKAIQAVIDVFLNYIETFTHCGNEIGGIDIHTDTYRISLIAQASEKGAIAAAQV
jgi:hypothetical protein